MSTLPRPPQSKAGQNIHERILLYGPAGAGKSRAALQVAAWHQKKESDAHFYVLSSDMAYERMMAPGTPFAELENVEVFDVCEWSDWRQAGQKAYDSATSEDWLVLDLIGDAWTAVQDHYIEGVMGQESDDFWSSKAAQGAEGWKLFEDINWTLVNKLYGKLARRYMMRFPGHVLAICAEAVLGKEEDALVTQWFGRLGAKPKGQKDLAYQFHTVIRMQPPIKKGGDWTMVTAKDREREIMEGVKQGSFWLPYLVQRGGWR